VGVIILVRVDVVDVGRADIYVRVVMMPLGKVVIHHRAKGRREQGPKSQNGGPCPQEGAGVSLQVYAMHLLSIICDIAGKGTFLASWWT